MEARTKANLASLMLLGAFSALPPLGQQEHIRAKANKPNEVLVPPPRRRFFEPTSQFDIDRLVAAEEKRIRKAAHTARCVAAGATKQLATPRRDT